MLTANLSELIPRSLQERSALEWGSQVKLVYSDMRSFYPREKADIIVSELLGSFGDNELSPECLDGVMRTLKREFRPSACDWHVKSGELIATSPAIADGISIPASYTSYLAPISTSRLHSEVTNPAVASASTIVDAKPAEQPYVVMFSQFHMLSEAGGRLGVDKVQECWTFDHPRPDVVVDDQGTFPRSCPYLVVPDRDETSPAHLADSLVLCG